MFSPFFTARICRQVSCKTTSRCKPWGRARSPRYLGLLGPGHIYLGLHGPGVRIHRRAWVIISADGTRRWTYAFTVTVTVTLDILSAPVKSGGNLAPTTQHNCIYLFASELSSGLRSRRNCVLKLQKAPPVNKQRRRGTVQFVDAAAPSGHQHSAAAAAAAESIDIAICRRQHQQRLTHGPTHTRCYTMALAVGDGAQFAAAPYVTRPARCIRC